MICQVLHPLLRLHRRRWVIFQDWRWMKSWREDCFIMWLHDRLCQVPIRLRSETEIFYDIVISTAYIEQGLLNREEVRESLATLIAYHLRGIMYKGGRCAHPIHEKIRSASADRHPWRAAAPAIIESRQRPQEAKTQLSRYHLRPQKKEGGGTRRSRMKIISTPLSTIPVTHDAKRRELSNSRIKSERMIPLLLSHSMWRQPKWIQVFERVWIEETRKKEVGVPPHL